MKTLDAADDGGKPGEEKAAPAVEVEEDVNEEDDEAEVEDALAEDAVPSQPETSQSVSQTVEVTWQGPLLRKAAGKTFYR